jgi:hypothetical protein
MPALQSVKESMTPESGASRGSVCAARWWPGRLPYRWWCPYGFPFLRNMLRWTRSALADVWNVVALM